MKKTWIICICAVIVLVCGLFVWAADGKTGYHAGDVNRDGKVQVSDALCVLKNVVGVLSLDDEQTGLADVDGSGKVDVSDALLILKYVIGSVDDQFQPKPAPAPGSSAKPTSQPDAEPSQKPTSMALYVEGSRLVDAGGKTAVLRGVSTHGLGWFPQYVNAACFKELHDKWKMNVVRLAMYTAESNGYCTGGSQKDLKDLVRRGVQYATDNHMYVIIDWHILSDGDPNTYKSQAKAFFKEMASQYKDYDNVLYEICNEPNGGASWKAIKSYAMEVISVIRAYDKDGIIIVGTPNWSQYVDQAAADPITGYNNIMYALHFYADTHRDDLRSTMVSAIQKGLPVFVTEYGICDASGNGAVNEAQANEWIRTMDKYGVSYVMWSLCNKAEAASVLNSSCTKTSGFADGDLSSTGRWLFKMLTGTAHIPPDPVTTAGPGSSTAEPGNPTAAPESPTAAPGGSAGTPGGTTTGTSGSMGYMAELKNSWQSGNEYFYQYSLTVTNKGNAACRGWSIEVPFSGAIALSQGWNGRYSVSGTKLRITSMDYNGALAPGQSVTDVGFIVSGGSGLQIAR